MRRILIALIVLWPGLAAAQSSDLAQALKLPQLAAILSQEAVRTGQEIDTEMLGGEGGAVFAAQISAINNADALAAALDQALLDGIPQADLAPLLGYLTSEQGQRAVDLELAARQAFLDPDIETFAQEQFARSPHAAQIDALIESGDMLRENRETAQLTTEAFYRGMRAGGALQLSDAGIADLARRQAEEGDADTRAWLQGYFALAYSPLDAADMAVVVAFWDTDVGDRFSQALYGAFDAIYAERWYAMGQAAALFLSAEDI